MATTRFALVLVAASLLVSCNTRYHLAGDQDAGAAGSGGGVGGKGGAAGVTGTAGAGTDGGAGTGGGAGTSGADARPEAAVPTGPVPLRISAREALTRVARALWQSPPDQTLVAMADSGALTTDEDVRKVALTMLGDVRARTTATQFYRWWLNLDALAATAKDPALFPEYSTALGTAMASETETFALNVTFDGDGRFPTLMRASYSYINAALANVYGLGGVVGSELRKVDLDPTQRAGILTQPAFLTQTSSQNAWTSPTHRGFFITDRILCRPPPTPPAGIPGQIAPEATAPETNRQRLTRSLASAACAACHRMMDPLGFTYEHFDSIGRFRLTDASGLPLDTSGQMVIDSDQSSWNNAIELAQILANSPQAHACLGQQWLHYVLGRDLNGADESSVAVIASLFEASGLDLRAVIAAAVTSPSFLDPAGGPPCTPGLAQTCNDDPKISSLHGTCTPAGKCVCNATYSLNTATGRCL